MHVGSVLIILPDSFLISIKKAVDCFLSSSLLSSCTIIRVSRLLSSIFHSHCSHCHDTGIMEYLGRQIRAENIRQKHKIQCNEEGKPISMQRSQVQGTVEENIQQLQHLVATTVPARKKRFFRTGCL